MAPNGFLILDKPLNMTSAQAVDRAKRILGRKNKIGHAGTLDPLASGVLILALGEATKLVSYAMDKLKTYQFEVIWGQERTTDDMEGEVTHSSDKRPTIQEIQAILPQFTGAIQQVPPNYSAIKQDGQRAYARARAGEEFALEPRQVRVDGLTVIPSEAEGSEDPSTPLRSAQDDSTSFTCQCGKGTYIRSLARDMGRTLGCYGTISRLRRTKIGKFSEDDAISLEKLEELVHKGDLGFIIPPQAMLDDILAISLNAEDAAKLKRGQSFPSPKPLPNDTLVMCEYEGLLVALARIVSGVVKPERVFNLI